MDHLPNSDDKRYTAAEAAEWLNVGVNEVYKLMREGQLGHFKIGSRKLIPESALRAFDEAAWVPPVASIGEHRLRQRATA